MASPKPPEGLAFPAPAVFFFASGRFFRNASPRTDSNANDMPRHHASTRSPFRRSLALAVRGLGALAVLAAAGCALDVEDVNSSTDVPASTTAALGCGSMCGQNGRIIDVPFHELHLDGKPTLEGTTLLGGVDHTGKFVRIDARQGTLYGTPLVGPEAPLQAGAQLYIDVFDSSVGGFRVMPLTITEVGLVDYWVAKPGAPTNSYRIMYSYEGGAERDVCPAGDPDDRLPAHHFVAVDNERYDGERLEVLDGADAARWVSFGCTGSSVAKLHMRRHTLAGSDANHRATREQRQALLKLFNADYCGDGQPYTQTGHPLSYLDDQNWFWELNWDGDLTTVGTVEAIWDEHGASCLIEPRFVPRDKVHCARSLPRCTKGQIRNWRKQGHLLSANPLW